MKSKILLIIRREYMTRVKKKSFLIMTILAPVLFASLAIIPALIMNVSSDKDTVAVVDESGIYQDKLKNTEKLVFTHVENVDTAKAQLKEDTYDLVLHIQSADSSEANQTALFYNKKQPGMDPVMAIQTQLQDVLQNKLLVQSYNITTEDYNRIKAIKIDVPTLDVQTGDEKNTAVQTGIGFASGILLFMFVMMFCTQVMQGVIEEKSNRIIEVIVSSVKPFQIMMGKIVGIALVGLTQFVLWIVLTLGIITVAGSAISSSFAKDVATAQTMPMNTMIDQDMTEQMADKMPSADMVGKLLEGFGNIDFTFIIVMFLIYFIGGYLLYASLFAAVGSAVDNEADTQQFMMPLTVPLMIGYIAAMMLVGNPHGTAAFWFSIVPLTSPMVMMMRVGFGVPVWELALSIGLLVAGFVFTTWLAAKIYRVGILMYGKKITYKELWKWLRY
ncbi:MAG: ABC transporter permease [Bacteroidales bacterium]|jgi:ABC-2 type transport system permease protein|nr:ABC transporter permease [Bacteroidales bacterium]